MKSKLVFIVDDDRMIRNLLEYTISSKEGYQVKIYPTSEECIKNMEEHPDLIVLDHHFASDNLPLMSGLEALVKIRSMEKKVPVIILSGQSNEQIIDEYIHLGATSYISKKDYFLNTLMETMEEVLPN